MAIITDSKNFNVSLTNKDSDWFSLLQFCICKVNPRYYKNIRIEYNSFLKMWWLHWDSLNKPYGYSYPFPVKTSKKTMKKLEENLPTYIKVDWSNYKKGV